MKRKTISLLLTLVMVLALIPGSAAPVYADSVTSYTSGAAAGTAGTPITYAISTEAQLRDLASSVNASPGAISYENTTFLLQNDITLTSNWVPIGKVYQTPFQGTFDGQGHEITGLKIGSAGSPETEDWYCGLFGYMNGGTIKYLNVSVAINTAIDNFIGGLVGIMESSTITNCHTNGYIYNEAESVIGGLVGYSNSGSTTENCYAAVDVYNEGDNHVGGLAGINYGHSTIKNCYATGNVATLGTFLCYAGGLVGANYGISYIENCYASGDTTGGDTGGGTSIKVGGLTGFNESGSTITHGYWNNDATQTINGVVQTLSEKKGAGNMNEPGLATSMTTISMKDVSFVTTLNDNVDILADPSLARWEKGSNYPTLIIELPQAAPTATVQSITGTTQVGQTLTGHYTYSDVNGDVEGPSAFQWYRSDDASGTNKASIAGATAITYLLQSADLGKYISFEVTPVAATGTTIGVPVESAKAGAIAAAQAATSDGGSGGSNITKATSVINTNTGSVTRNQLSNAAAAAKDGETVTIKSNETDEVTLPASGLDSLSGKNNSLTVVTENGTLIFNSKAVDAMGTQAADEDIKVIVEDVVKTALTEAQQTEVGDKTVYDLTVMSGGKLISNFNGGKVTVSIPYDLKSGETAEDLKVWYMADNGSLTEINCTYDTKNKVVTFVVEHFSKYIIGYDEVTGWVNPFTDLKSSAWYYDAAVFVNTNGLMKGQTDTTFAPQTAMTRGMFVTILGRMEGIDATAYASKNTFSDVKSNEYYAPYIAWAMEKGIVSGVSADKFAPSAPVTREQMAVMMTNYLKAIGEGPTGEWAIQLTYSDLDQVSSWADEAVMFMTMKGLMNGTGNDAAGNPLFAPKSTSTRAQTAQVMMSLGELLN